MTELMLGVGPHHTERLAVGADNPQCTRTEGFSRFVQIRRDEDGVKPKAGFALNFRGDGPLADPFPDQDLLAIPKRCNGLKGSGAEVFDADGVIVNEVRKEAENPMIPNGRKGVRGIDARKSIQSVNEETSVLNHHHGILFGQVFHSLGNFRTCYRFQIIGLWFNNRSVWQIQAFDLDTELLKVVCSFL